MTLADTIRAALLRHCKQGNLVMGQNLRATPENVCVPEHKNVWDLPTSDVSNSGTACGHALAGRRLVYVVRYQGFGIYNLASIVNYAAKSKALWKTPCPIFVRAIANEGSIGPVAGGCHHSAAMRFPGIRVVAPMTPSEWAECWEEWQGSDDVVWCSEHRSAYKTELPREMGNWQAKVTVFGISAARFNHPIGVNAVGIYRLKPFKIGKVELECLRRTKLGLVVDSDYATCGAAEHTAMELMRLVPGSKVEAMGVEDRVAGFSEWCDVLTPNAEQIVARVKQLEAA